MRSSRSALVGSGRLLFAFGVAALMLVPMVWAISGSLHTNATLFENPFNWLPAPAHPENYPNAWAAGDIGRQLLNSFVVALTLSVVGVVLAQMAGYAFAKLRFLGRDFLFWSIVSTLTLPFPAIMVPVFMIARSFGLINSFGGLIIPVLISTQAVFFTRQYVMALPNDLLECARVDGASEWAIYRRIVLPLSWPVLAAMGILVFVGSWNDLLWPLLVVNSSDMFTVPVGLTQFNGKYFTDYVSVLSLSLIAMLPVIVLFLFTRRRLLDAVMVSGGAVRG